MNVRPRVDVLVSSPDRALAAAVLDGVRAAGLTPTDLTPGGEPAAAASSVLFFASASSTEPGAVLDAAHASRRHRRLVGVALDDVGVEILRGWPGVTVVDARTDPPAAVAAAVLEHLPPGVPGDAPPTSGRPLLLISYSRQDKPFVDDLIVWLETQGWDHWEYLGLDRDAQVNREREFGRKIREADAVAFVLSPSWAASRDCVKELDGTTTFGKPFLLLELKTFDRAVVNENIAAANRLRIDFRTNRADGLKRLSAQLQKIRLAGRRGPARRPPGE